MVPAVTIGSTRLHNLETVDFLNCVRHVSLEMAVMKRVDTLFTTFSIKARNSACSLR